MSISVLEAKEATESIYNTEPSCCWFFKERPLQGRTRKKKVQIKDGRKEKEDIATYNDHTSPINLRNLNKTANYLEK